MSDRIYSVKECFRSLQGEGANAGKTVVFCRFTGCNLWNGKDDEREDAVCKFCDTDFVGTDGEGGGKFSARELAVHLTTFCQGMDTPSVVCTGGEPLLQLDLGLVQELKELGFWIAVETNGTKPTLEGLDWITVSPKSTAPIVVTAGDELKLVYPQHDAPPDRFARLSFKHFFLQPMDGPDLELNTKLATQYCLDHPQWRLSLQIHKLLGLR
jgi:7-carboxy-7-deazaguanine synthase (Cx14CxxC type)